MKNDPIVDQARAAGSAYIASLGGDIKTVLADLQRRTNDARKAGRKVVALPPRKPTRRAKAS